LCAETENYRDFNPFNGRIIYPYTDEGYTLNIQDIPRNTYYHGYWIDWRWFKRYEDTLSKEFVFPPIADYKNQKLMDEIINGNSVSVHVRRGDYVKLGFAQSMEIYRACVEECIKKEWNLGTLYVFSDDIGWCRLNETNLGFDRFAKIVYVEGNVKGLNYIDLQLMSNCKGMIISNSAFCYLAAILNSKKRFIVNSTDRVICK
jgi:hypothetical protein